MAKTAKHPELGIMLDINTLSTLTGISRNKIYYREFKAKPRTLPWPSYFAPSKPTQPWYRAADVLAWIEKHGGYGGIGRLPAPNDYISTQLTKKENE